jgi:predicted  nucleic acid-binding Zn-ribbon protein
VPTGEELEQLIAVQERDRALDRLRTQSAELQQRARLTELHGQQRALAGEASKVAEALAEVAGEEARLDDEVQAAARKADEVERTLYGGTVTSPRELQALQSDLESLRAHQSRLEDRELEWMEQRESLETQNAEVERRQADLVAEIERTGHSLAEDDGRIAEEMSREEDARRALTDTIDPALVADYEARRARNRGIGVAVLVGSTCQACGLSIPAVEVDRFRHAPPGTICTPEECHCILVARS